MTARLTGAVRPDIRSIAPGNIDVFGAQTIYTTVGAGLCPATTQIGKLLIQNTGTALVYVGPTASLTTANGIMLEPVPAGANAGGSVEIETSASMAAIVASGTGAVRVLRTKY